MFINKMKEQLLPTEKGCSLAPPHYPALLTVPTSVALPTGIAMDSDTKPEQLTPHSQAPVTQNITVVPVQSAGLMTAGRGLQRRLQQGGRGGRESWRVLFGPGVILSICDGVDCIGPGRGFTADLWAVCAPALCAEVWLPAVETGNVLGYSLFSSVWVVFKSRRIKLPSVK